MYEDTPHTPVLYEPLDDLPTICIKIFRQTLFSPVYWTERGVLYGLEVNRRLQYIMEGQNMETREEIITWIVEQLRKLPLGYLYQVRGFVRGFLK